MKALADREVWFVTGRQHLYGVSALVEPTRTTPETAVDRQLEPGSLPARAGPVGAGERHLAA